MRKQLIGFAVAALMMVGAGCAPETQQPASNANGSVGLNGNVNVVANVNDAGNMNAATNVSTNVNGTVPTTTGAPTVEPITHASFILTWGEIVIYNDPTGGASAYAGKAPADIVLVSDVHGDHLNADTIRAVLADDTALIAPQAVIDQLPDDLKSRATVLANGASLTQDDISIRAVPMYNVPEAADSRHVKGRGNGYVLERDGYTVYIAGDTGATSEMTNLANIDMAFLPMNPPFTMTVEEAADATLKFKPARVYPYHYRGQAGLSDVAQFKSLVNAGDSNIEVIQLNWYPEEAQ